MNSRIPDTVEMGEAVRLAETAMAQLNGATRMLCPEFHGARIESIVELLSNGTGRGIVSCPITIHGTSDFPAIADFLNSDSVPISSILSALKSDKDVQDALFYLGADGNAWANLYKVTEIVAESTGGKDFVFQKGWCSRTAWDRFRRTADHQEAIGHFSRHARSRVQPPPDPMTDTEARRFAGALVKKWIEAVTTEARKE